MDNRKRVVPESVDTAIKVWEEGNMVDLKPITDLTLKSEIIKAGLENENLSDPLMLLNILNLIKMYNTLDDSYFSSPDVYVNSIEELLDLKLNMSKELKAFTRKLSVYFLSLLKSYNKLTYTPSDEHIELPNIYDQLFLAMDLMTMAGMFSKVTDISTDELIYIDNAYVFMSSMVLKEASSANLVNIFYSAIEGSS